MSATVLRLPHASRTYPVSAHDRAWRLGDDIHLPHRKLGEILLEAGDLSASNLNAALELQGEAGGRRLGEILLEQGEVSETRLASALAQQHGVARVDLVARPPDVRLLDKLGAEACLRWGLVPWQSAGAAVVVVTSRPETFARNKPALERALGPVLMALAEPKAITQAIVAARASELSMAADTRTEIAESCRGLESGRLSRGVLAGLAAILGLAVAAPVAAFTLLSLWAVVALSLITGLRTAAAVAEIFARIRLSRRFTTQRAEIVHGVGPVVSLLVPLLREVNLIDDLVNRLCALEYPTSALEICLIVEADDEAMINALALRDLPGHFQIVQVPRSRIKTKPRALNYALDFCRGTIVGVYDAEDAPEPDQICKVVRHFATAPPDVACLQGKLDFYNARQNWMSRCFAVDYATWFRVILPGLSRMGFAIPLGGTTLFFRRAALEDLGRWDAHNVTEDADLGIRLARRGYRAELIETTTREEATCHVRPWIRQRSRWLKGYALTYAVHMRRPRQLWQELGPKRFFGFQMLFLCTISLFLLAPVLWSFWLLPFGIAHPLQSVLPTSVLLGVAALFVISEVLTITTEMIAVSTPRHRWLMPWVITLHFYFPLAAFAAWKGLFEIITKPFYWDKTTHGLARNDGH